MASFGLNISVTDDRLLDGTYHIQIQLLFTPTEEGIQAKASHNVGRRRQVTTLWCKLMVTKQAFWIRSETPHSSLERSKPQKLKSTKTLDNDLGGEEIRSWL